MLKTIGSLLVVSLLAAPALAEDEVPEKLSTSTVREVVKKNIETIKKCSDKLHGTASVTFKVKFVVLPTGRTDNVAVSGGGDEVGAARKCVGRAFLYMRFPKAQKELPVTYPVKLKRE